VTLTLTVVDAFTDERFTGNPAAVSFLDAFPDDSRLLAVAREMNLPETAFVVPRGSGEYDLRWFSPQVEVDLCGHATLAAAHVLGGSPRFHPRGGLLVCRTANDGWIEMDFPADHLREATMPAELELPGVCWYGIGQRDALVELEDASIVRALTPELESIAALGTRALTRMADQRWRRWEGMLPESAQ
jgi:predicted PhzF superfamily epimerase YddE/YHI9